MNISDLKEFLALAERGSFQEAADDCFMSQSTLSKHIKRLENEIGYTLFLRGSTKVYLSEYGKQMLPYARQIVSTSDDCLTALRNYDRRLHETLSIGSSPVMVPYGITSVISGFCKSHPSCFVNIVEGETPELVDLIRQKKLRLAFIITGDSEKNIAESDEPDAEFICIPYRQDVLSVVLPISHRFANKKSLSPALLSDEVFISWPTDTIMYQRCYRFLSQNYFQPNIILSAPRGQSMVEMVGQNIGISIMLKQQADFVGNLNTVTVPLESTAPVYIYLIYGRQSALSKTEKKFIEYTKTFQDLTNS